MHTTSFKDFLMREELKNRISSFGFEHPSEVQQQCLPNSLLGLDILCQAKAGMGKTAVFILTILNRFLEGNIKGEGAVLVLTHTRELAFQISKEFINFSQGLDIKTLLIIGGENTQDQVNKIKNEKPNIIIGTPGRILALIKKKDLNCEHVQVFVIDECDKMLSALGKIIIFIYFFFFIIFFIFFISSKFFIFLFIFIIFNFKRN
jgi:ATP-dependent RNA helicase UAP56/SUB2